MSLLLLGASLAVIVFAATSTLGAALSTALFRMLESRLDTIQPSSRAHLLFRLRLLPTGLATVFTAGLFVPAFLLLEPRDAVEDVGPALALLSIACVAMILRGPVTATRDWRRTRALVEEWLRQSVPLPVGGIAMPAHLVEAPFPVVAVFGIRRRRLLVARSVRDACTNEELSAILAHERAHVANGDNLKRILFRGAPDPMAGTRLAARIELAWDGAVEESADEETQPSLALPLASALVKVTRLALDAKLVPAAGSALYRTGSIDRRVRRLMAMGETRPLHRSRTLSFLLSASALAALGLAVPIFDLLPRIHRATEAFVALFQ